MLKQLTAVAPRDNDALTLKRGHALAWTMLLFMVIGLALGGIALIDLDVPALINTAVGMVVFILVYAINRGGRVQLAATILIIAGGCITVSGAIVAQRPIPTLFFLGIIVVVAAAFGRPIAPLGWAAALSLTSFIINAAVY